VMKTKFLLLSVLAVSAGNAGACQRLSQQLQGQY
jgi:hypothetical protein